MLACRGLCIWQPDKYAKKDESPDWRYEEGIARVRSTKQSELLSNEKNNNIAYGYKYAEAYVFGDI